MDVYQSTIDYLLTFSIFDVWYEMETILRRAASGRPRDWQLPVMACQALGESPERAIPASAARACAQISIILVDDILDEDPRGEYHRIGSGRAANFAVAFQAVGAEALVRSQASTQVKVEALNSLNQMMLKTAQGQDLDIQNPADESSYWRVVKNKSAPFYGCALHLGALLGEASTYTARGLERLGEMIQIHDDLSETMAVPANPDWLQGLSPLPILFAQSVDHPDRARSLELYQNISAENALQEAQDILNKTPLPNKGTVDSLIEAVITPVWKLFETLGISPDVHLRLQDS